MKNHSLNLLLIDSSPCFSTSKAEVNIALASRLVDVPAMVMSDYATRSFALTGQLGHCLYAQVALGWLTGVLNN